MKKFSKILFFIVCNVAASISFAESKENIFPDKFNFISLCEGADMKSWNSCVGEIKLPDGTAFLGDFANGKAHGVGYFSNNGSKVLGNFSNDQVGGLALLLKSNGDRYAGYFKEGKFHGQGIYKKNDGEIISGKWKNDNFKEKIEVPSNDLIKIIEIDLEAHLARVKSNLNDLDKNKNADASEVKNSTNSQVNFSKLPTLTVYAPAHSSLFKTINDINNKRILENPSQLSGRRKYIGVCLLIDEKEFEAEGIDYIKESLSNVLVDYFAELAPNNEPVKIEFKGSQYFDLPSKTGKQFSHSTDCWNWQLNQLILGSSDLVIIRDKDEQYLAKKEVVEAVMPNPRGVKYFNTQSSYASDWNLFTGYKPLFKIDNSIIIGQQSKIKVTKKQEYKDKSDRDSKFKVFAEKNTKEVVSSISIYKEDSLIPGGELSLCSYAYEGADQMAIEGYALLGFEPYSEAFKNKITKSSSNPSIRKKIESFKDINEFYINYQLPEEPYNKKIRCDVFVDYPSNLNIVLESIQRNNVSEKVELNAIHNSEALRDKFISINTPFKLFVDYQFASSIGATANDLEILRQSGVGDMNGFNGLVIEMQKAKYSDSRNISDVISYLKDKKEGGSIQGAIKVRNARQALQAKMMKDAMARQRKLDLMRANKVFKQGVICVGNQSLAYGQMQVIVDLYGRGANIRSITDFVLNSNSCFLKDVLRKGSQLREVMRSGNFVMVQDSSYVSPYTGYGMLHVNDWDNP